MRKTTAGIIAVAAALALTAALTITTIAVAATHAPIADIVIGVVAAAQPTTVRRPLCKLPVEPVLRRCGLQLPPQGRFPVRPMPPHIRALRRLFILDLPLQLVALPHATVAAAAAAAAADISADRDYSITMPGALQASLRIRPPTAPPFAFLDGADVPGGLRADVNILVVLLYYLAQRAGGCLRTRALFAEPFAFFLA